MSNLQTPKMGDTVKIIHANEGYTDAYVGSEGVVLKACPPEYVVEFDGDGYEVYFYDGELEVIE